MFGKEIKKKEKKSQYPKKSYRSLVQKIFWVGFFSVLGLSLISMSRTINIDNRLQCVQEEIKGQKKAIEEIPKVEKETTEKVMSVNEDGAKLFAGDFVRQYYTWGYGEGKAQERSGRLVNYFAKGLDSTGGYDISAVTQASRVISCIPWSITVAENMVDVLIRVQYDLTEQKQDKKKVIDHVIFSGERYLNVRLVTDGKEFAVKELPYLVQQQPLMDYTIQETTADSNLLIADEAVCDEVKGFMETFLKIATTGTKEELGYYTAAEVNSLNGSYEFLGIPNISVYQDDKEGYKISANVYMQDTQTKASVLLKCECKLVKDKERFIVAEISY